MIQARDIIAAILAAAAGAAFTMAGWHPLIVGAEYGWRFFITNEGADAILRLAVYTGAGCGAAVLALALLRRPSGDR